MTANSTPESFDAVLSDMLDNEELRWSDDAHYFADRLQSAHARELAEQQAAIEALRSEVAQEKFIAEAETMYSQDRDAHLADANARADAAMGLLREVVAAGNTTERIDAFLAQQALAGGERKDG